MPPLLEVRDLEAGYGPITVLHRVSLTVERGEIVAMIGANGAGKSTTLMCLSVVVKSRAGRVAFAGRVLRSPASLRAAATFHSRPVPELSNSSRHRCDARRDWRN